MHWSLLSKYIYFSWVNISKKIKLFEDSVFSGYINRIITVRWTEALTSTISLVFSLRNTTWTTESLLFKSIYSLQQFQFHQQCSNAQKWQAKSISSPFPSYCTPRNRSQGSFWMHLSWDSLSQLLKENITEFSMQESITIELFSSKKSFLRK